MLNRRVKPTSSDRKVVVKARNAPLQNVCDDRTISATVPSEGVLNKELRKTDSGLRWGFRAWGPPWSVPDGGPEVFLVVMEHVFTPCCPSAKDTRTILLKASEDKSHDRPEGIEGTHASQKIGSASRNGTGDHCLESISTSEPCREKTSFVGWRK